MGGEQDLCCTREYGHNQEFRSRAQCLGMELRSARRPTIQTIQQANLRRNRYLRRYNTAGSQSDGDLEIPGGDDSHKTQVLQ